MPISPADFMAMQQRTSRARGEPECPAPRSGGVAKESLLHDQIKMELGRRRWFYVHNRMDKPTTFDGPKGTTPPDFIIAKPYSKTLWVECKADKGKLSTEQQATFHWLNHDNHITATVYSFQDFLNLVDKACAKPT